MKNLNLISIGYSLYY